MLLTFLKAPIALTKSFSKNADGTISKSSYPNAYEVTTIDETAPDLRAFAALLIKHATLGHCLLKGNPTRALSCESRAGTTDSNAVTDWIVLDIDGVDGVSSIDAFLQTLNLGDVSYVLQWSASFGITSKSLRAHVFMQLAKPMPAPLIKQWLMQINHTTPILNAAMSLTKTGMALSWPLDITACQNDKLLYIAPPLLKGVKDPFKAGQRITFVKKTTDLLTLAVAINSTAQNRELNHKRIAELRAAANLPLRKLTYKMHGSKEVLVKPDACDVTETRVERGFVYFNLNGGDSWGYYHPEDNPDFIYNFKGEPVYVTKELLPDYWNALTQQVVRTSSQGVTYLAFSDRKTSQYWRGTYDQQTDTLDIHRAKTERLLRDFAKQHGLPLGDFVPEWDIVFDPKDNVRVDTVNRTVNTFQPSQYMQAFATTPPKPQPVCPKLIHRVIHHALGSDTDTTNHFINWVAFILQNRVRSRTAWVMHGTTGTGKGILMNNILRPLFGAEQTAVRNMASLDEKWTGFMDKSFIVFIDEMESKAMNNERGMMARLFSLITEATVTMRMMNVDPYEVTNYTNWIFASNKSDPIIINKEDRRFHVGIYQPVKIPITQKEIDHQIPRELQAFHDYLMQYKVDSDKVTTPLTNADRNNMVSLSGTSVESVADALLDGNFEFFVDMLPTTESYKTNMVEMNKVENYREVLRSILARTSATTGACNIYREEVRVLFEYAGGNFREGPVVFTQAMRKLRIHIKVVAINNKSSRGISVVWKDIKHFPAYDETISPKQVMKPKLKAVK